MSFVLLWSRIVKPAKQLFRCMLYWILDMQYWWPKQAYFGEVSYGRHLISFRCLWYLLVLVVPCVSMCISCTGERVICVGRVLPANSYIWRRSPVDGNQIDIPCLRYVWRTSRNFCPYRCSSVGVSTRYGLGGPGIESVWGEARISAPIQTGSGAQPGLFPGGTDSWDRLVLNRRTAWFWIVVPLGAESWDR